MFRKFFIILFAFTFCLLSATLAFAQNEGSTRGSMAGTVSDPSKAVVPGATVTVTGPLGNATQTSNAQGAFVFRDLVPGSYSVKVQKTGFSNTVMPAIDVLINNTATVNVTLNPGSVETTVEVSGASQAIDTTNSSVNSNLTDDFYNNVPVKRNVSSIMLLAPGAVSGGATGNMTAYTSMSGNAATYANPSISGASGLENLYVADGVVLNDASFGGFGGFSTQYGALGSGITPAFVKEVEIKTAAFEPQYGHATGGVVQIVTKSGSRNMHGTIGGYFQPQSFEKDYLNKDNFNPVNLTGIHHNNASYEGDLELGGYVPGLRDHMFYFLAYNPQLFHNYVSPAATAGLFLTNPNYDRKTYTQSYAAKLTYQVNSKLTVESSVFGDPSHTNAVPWFTLASNNTSANSNWNYGSRNWSTRVQTTLSPTWTADVAYTYFWNHFTENPAFSSLYPIDDQTQTAGLPGQAGEFQSQGLADMFNYKSQGQSLTFDTQKIVRAAGNHTLSVGYFWQDPRYDSVTVYSVPRYAIPGTNLQGTSSGTASGAGKLSDGSFELQLAPATCTLCPLMNVPGYATPQAVVLKQARGRFDGGVSANYGKYHAAYVSDAWELSKYATLDVGLRWEQQRLVGSASKAIFNDQWSPRIGFIVDPTGDRTSKIYTQFSRLAYVLPLDMAVRELSAEDDNLNEYFAPAFDPATNMVTLDQFGTVNVIPDQAHLLNGANGGMSKLASLSIQVNGEPFVPPTRFEYNDEWVIGAEHEFHGGFHGSVRYVDRRMKRVVEDQVGQSVEQLTALAFNGGSYSYVIGNPNANESIFVTPNEQTWSLGSNWTGGAALAAAQASPSAATTAALLASGYPAGCIDSNGIPTPYNAPNMQSSLGAVAGTFVGSACFPAVNGQPNAVLDSSTGTYDLANPAALYGGEYFPHGCQYCKPGLYPNPQRNYQAVEFELNKAFSNNWLMVANFRVGHLAGNYEGAFRNDNNQSDPGISSLFDLTDGQLGLLGQQLGIGPLNTDRRYVLHILPSYTIPKGFVKNMAVGVGINVQSGTPLTTLAAQEIYGNAGEVPINGRGDLGRTPVIGTVDTHLEYPIKFTESKQLKLSFDAFNIANTRRTILSTQSVDLGFATPNLDFNNHVPLVFQPPFSARLSAAFTF